MGANVGIASLIGTIVLVVIGLMMLGLIEDGVTDALSESKPVIVTSSLGFTLNGVPANSWYANKVVNEVKSLPPGYAISGFEVFQQNGPATLSARPANLGALSAGHYSVIRCSGVLALNDARDGIACSNWLSRTINLAGTLDSGHLTAAQAL